MGEKVYKIYKVAIQCVERSSVIINKIFWKLVYLKKKGKWERRTKGSEGGKLSLFYKYLLNLHYNCRVVIADSEWFQSAIH